MTAPDPRLEAVTVAVRGLKNLPDGDALTAESEDFIARYDAIRAFDEQRKEVMQHTPDEHTNSRPGGHNATAPAASPVGADPPRRNNECVKAGIAESDAGPCHLCDPSWLEEGYGVFRDASQGPTKGARIYAGLRAFARFAAAQPPSEDAVDAGIEAAAEAVTEWDSRDFAIAETAARAALKARAGG